MGPLSVCLSCLSACDISVLWPNGLTDQDETWQAGRPRPSPHCVRWGPSSPSPKGAQPPQFSAHIHCGQMAAQIKIPLGMEVGLSAGRHCVRWGPSSPSPKGAQPPQFSAHICCGQMAAWIKMSLGMELLWLNGWMDEAGTWYGGRPQPTTLCVRWGRSPPNFRPMFIVAKWLDGSRWHLAWR